jgi:hypothetical protein
VTICGRSSRWGPLGRTPQIFGVNSTGPTPGQLRLGLDRATWTTKVEAQEVVEAHAGQGLREPGDAYCRCCSLTTDRSVTSSLALLNVRNNINNAAPTLGQQPAASGMVGCCCQ